MVYMYSYLKFHSRVYHRPMPSYTVAYYMAYSLECIDSLRLSSTLHALYLPHLPQRPSKLNRSASISGTLFGKSGVATPWGVSSGEARPPGSFCRFIVSICILCSANLNSDVCSCTKKLTNFDLFV